MESYNVVGLSGMNRVNADIYIISDTLFNYRDAMEHLGRPFRSVQDMNQHMVKQWNSVVQPNDVVFHIGNIAIGNNEEIREILLSLNGKINLIAGNHDTKGSSLSCRERFSSVNYKLEIEIDGQMITMNHYPQFWWNGLESGAMMVHGHLCGQTPTMQDKRILDAGADNMDDYIPMHYLEVCDVLEAKIPRGSLGDGRWRIEI